MIQSIDNLCCFFSGGNTDYFVDNITHFHLTESVFDLVLLATVKIIFYFVFISLLETNSFRQIENPYDPRLTQKIKIFHVFVVLFSFLVFGFTVTKGGLVLNKILNDSSYSKMHAEYNALVISAVCFNFLELITSFLSFGAMRRLKVIRILHRFNDSGKEVDEDGKVIQKKASIKRLVILAKPVSII